MLEKKVNIANVLFVFLFFVCIISQVFNISYLGYLDEVITIICGGYFLLQLIQKKVDRNLKIIFFVVIIIFFIGLLGNAFNDICDVSLQNIFLDMFLISKPYIILLGCCCYFKNNYNTQLITSIKVLFMLILIIVFFFAVVYLINNFEIRKFTFFASRIGVISNISIVMCVFLVSFSKRYLLKLTVFVMTFVIVFATGTGLGLLGLFIILLMCIIFGKFRFRTWYLIPVLVLGVFISFNEIKEYFLDSDAARAIFLRYSFVTGNKFFPFGSGFGTYGTYVAQTEYSDLYFYYGFDSIWGLSPSNLDNNNFLSDSYYPIIIGQFGYIGVTIYFEIIGYFIYSIYKKFKMNSNYSASLALLIYFLSYGLGFNVSNIEGCIMFCMLALLFYSCEKSESVNYN